MLPSRMVSRMAHTSQHSVAPTWLQNRGTEAGESGDAVVDSDTGKMQKYYDACVNESGSKVPCRIGRGDKYIEVVSSALERCNDPESRRNCTMIFEDEEKTTCEANIKWCRQYKVKQVPEDAHEFSMSYIPTSSYCVDQNGLPTQEGCYYHDKITPADRQRAGEYEYCSDGVPCNLYYHIC